MTGYGAGYHLAAMGRIRNADIDDDSRRLILGANTWRAFGLGGE
jgi:hypothetical protein